MPGCGLHWSMEPLRLFDMNAIAPVEDPPLLDDGTLSDEKLRTAVSRYPRIRFMGSKFRLAADLAEIFQTLPAGPAVDAFSGSGVVSYTLKAVGRSVTSNDHLNFAAVLADAVVANDAETLESDDVDRICSGNLDGRSFIASTFDGLYFSAADHAFLDAAWSHIAEMRGKRRSLAISGLCLAAARKQPRGVFTVTTPRYDDGRRQFRMSLEELFREAVTQLNTAVFRSPAATCRAVCGDVFDLDPEEFAVAYLDPPYAPPKDDTDYIKRYHFLEGLAVYWRDAEIMWDTRTRKLRKRHTPFAYKRTAVDALDRLFQHFSASALVVSYGSNSALSADEIERLLKRHKRFVRLVRIPHSYTFGTHSRAQRREATEFVFVAT